MLPAPVAHLQPRFSRSNQPAANLKPARWRAVSLHQARLRRSSEQQVELPVMLKRAVSLKWTEKYWAELEDSVVLKATEQEFAQAQQPGFVGKLTVVDLAPRLLQ